MIHSAVTLSLVPEATGGPFVFWNDANDAIRTACELGFDAIEVFPPDAQTVQALQLPSRLSGLKVAAIGTGAGWVKHKLLLCDPDGAQRRRAIEFVESIMRVAASLETSAIVGSMQGRSSPTLSKSEARKWLRDSLEQLNELATVLGRPLFYEPLNRYETDQATTLAQGAELIDGLGSTLLLADWFHMNIEEADMVASIRDCAGRIGHVHFADSNRQAIGKGHLDWLPLVQALEETGYSGYLSAEVFSLPSAREAAQQTIDSFNRIQFRSTATS
ncbi:D-tagatose 3-epimerase [Pirellula sp. SH-Sr6A]|uniref:sugar phosphate isomerase/epimerase family protein n=1 Tax=Pirellula sp. SH-Sr6A TaxID=1632865 RepID=UPI00078D931C|nr:sugar phosphate isomerase/epimerase family protein [Pirellula sp. SH-Sr6A]AMV34793.1 D-tagatose 3-epimerase [Pirellula sp. SH-Sr6A]